MIEGRNPNRKMSMRKKLRRIPLHSAGQVRGRVMREGEKNKEKKERGIIRCYVLPMYEIN
jgi:hypothetical protein